MARTASISLRVEPDLLDRAKKAAKRDRRTVAAMMEKLLVEHLDRVERVLDSREDRPNKEKGEDGSDESDSPHNGIKHMIDNPRQFPESIRSELRTWNDTAAALVGQIESLGERSGASVSEPAPRERLSAVA